MNDNAKAWVAALRSGKYEQGRDYLRDEDDNYCCLGVACELAVQARVIDPPELGAEAYCYSGLAGVLPDEVREWLGLVGDLGKYVEAGPDGKPDGLARKNDEGASFEEIADIIEREPEGLFA